MQGRKRRVSDNVRFFILFIHSPRRKQLSALFKYIIQVPTLYYYTRLEQNCTRFDRAVSQSFQLSRVYIVVYANVYDMRAHAVLLLIFIKHLAVAFAVHTKRI